MVSTSVIRIVAITLSFLFIALNAWFLYYVEELKKQGCQCAMGWRRTFVQASLMVFLVFGVLGLFMNWSRHFPWLVFLLNLISLAYIVVTREFIEQVKASHCTCAETDAFDVLNWLNMFQIIMLVAVVIMFIIALITVASIKRKGGKAGKARR